MDKIDLVVRLIEELRDNNKREHDRVFEELEKLKSDVEPIKLSKAQIATYGTIITAIATALVTVIQAFAG